MGGFVGALAEMYPAASVGGLALVVAYILGLKSILAVFVQHLEMRATARRMRIEGASKKEIARFLSDHSLKRSR